MIALAFRVAWEMADIALHAAMKQRTQRINAAIRIAENDSRKTKLMATCLPFSGPQQVIETRRHWIAAINALRTGGARRTLRFG
jgi:hypothetical protein